MGHLRTRSVQNSGDIRAFFDASAGSYREMHGSANLLLDYRLKLIRRLLAPGVGGVLLEIGCGPGVHLFPLADQYSRAIGEDLSPNMIAAAETIRRTHPCAARIELHAEPAERLASIKNQAADAVLCVGALEHMPDKPAVLAEVRRVLKPGGRFVCLTVNGDYLWYRRIAPWLGYEVKHLSSDHFVTEGEMRTLLQGAELRVNELGYWRFVAMGDMPGWTARFLLWLDRAGMLFKPSLLRGGLYVCAEKGLAPGIS
jgi:2-polyprenyl-6-hydroxyphenyl methylase/3-demethylubiquinone-9 3-methyltransferase